MNVSYKTQEDLTLTVYINEIEIGKILASGSGGFIFEFKDRAIKEKYYLYGATADKIKQDLEDRLEKAMKIGKVLINAEGGKQ